MKPYFNCLHNNEYVIKLQKDIEKQFPNIIEANLVWLTLDNVREKTNNFFYKDLGWNFVLKNNNEDILCIPLKNLSFKKIELIKSIFKKELKQYVKENKQIINKYFGFVDSQGEKWSLQI
ncbi:hypothetical protein [Spiroplasma tabanidicola]|uniref:Uncharacterized protein n=1 Tax=Spiroplasma tabanidicola TaxID=324079 RepID=A0A6I6C3R9_9MOLU|nr:hypothetical protein [Spiroplasma tabanidicola]QGS51447.1 hypothetical protein STABA_v1c00800 [Spiroplasma tabanidicola]